MRLSTEGAKSDYWGNPIRPKFITAEVRNSYGKYIDTLREPDSNPTMPPLKKPGIPITFEEFTKLTNVVEVARKYIKSETQDPFEYIKMVHSEKDMRYYAFMLYTGYMRSLKGASPPLYTYNGCWRCMYIQNNKKHERRSAKGAEERQKKNKNNRNNNSNNKKKSGSRNPKNLQGKNKNKSKKKSNIKSI